MIKFISVILVSFLTIYSCKSNIEGVYLSKKNNITHEDNKSIIFFEGYVGYIFEYGYAEGGAEVFKGEFDYRVINDTIFIDTCWNFNSDCYVFKLDSTYFIKKRRKLIHYPSESRFVFKKNLIPRH